MRRKCSNGRGALDEYEGCHAGRSDGRVERGIVRVGI